MTTDNDDNLEAFAHRARRVAITSEPTAHDTRTLADALGVALEVIAATRREMAVIGRQVLTLAEQAARERDAHRETQRLVDAMAGPVVAAPATLEFRSLDGKHTRTVTVDTDARPLAPALTLSPGCDDCSSPFVALGHRFCARCQERDQLRAALREALDMLAAIPHEVESPSGVQAFDVPGTGATTDARIAELRRLL